MSNICTNNLVITGPLDCHALLALTIATRFTFNPLGLNLAAFDQDDCPLLPDSLSDPEHVFIGDCDAKLNEEGALEFWADSKFEPPLDWLEAMTMRFPEIGMALEYLQPEGGIAGRAFAFNKHLCDHDEPVETFVFSN